MTIQVIDPINVSQPWGCTLNPVEIPDPSCSRVPGTPGYRHTGIDLAAPEGTPIYATRDQVVAQIGPWTNDINGRPFQPLGPYAVVANLTDGSACLAYGHLSANEFRVGDLCRVGQMIGRVGNLGVSTGPHLHLEAQPVGTSILTLPSLDPTPYLFSIEEAQTQVTRILHDVGDNKVYLWIIGVSLTYVGQVDELADLERVLGLSYQDVGDDTLQLIKKITPQVNA